MKEDQKAWAEDEHSRHILAINKTWGTAGFYSQPRFNERKNNKKHMVGHNVARRLQTISWQEKLGKEILKIILNS